MSLHEYLRSEELAKQNEPFYALIMAAMRKADTGNANELHRAFPKVWAELEQRYNSPGGFLPGEHEETTLKLVVNNSGLVPEPLPFCSCQRICTCGAD